MRLTVAVDKFRGTATAAQVSQAAERAASARGWQCRSVRRADGGEGLLDAYGGANRWSTVTGPLGHPVRAAWRAEGDQADASSLSGKAVGGSSGAPARRVLRPARRAPGASAAARQDWLPR
jgi:glycerate kinase